MTRTPTNRLLALELDDRIIGLLNDLLTRLGQHWGLTIESGLRMGSGTALAMYWHHRHSTDVDLSVLEDEFNKGWVNGARSLREYLNKQKQQGEIKWFRYVRGCVGWERPNSGEVSLSLSRLERRNATHQEATTGIPLAPIRDILGGKLLGRVLTQNRLLVRDAYDLCTAAEQEPHIFKEVIDEAYEIPEHMHTLINRIKSTNKRIIEGRPIIEPADTGLTYDPWRRFVELAEPILQEIDDERAQKDTRIRLKNTREHGE